MDERTIAFMVTRVVASHIYVSRRAGENKLSRGSGLGGLPLRPLLSLRRDFRLKVSPETAFRLRTAPTASRLIFTRPEATANTYLRTKLKPIIKTKKGLTLNEYP